MNGHIPGRHTRSAVIAAALLLVANVSSRPLAADVTPAEAANVSLAEVVAGVQALEARLGNMSCTSDFVMRQQFADPAGDRPAKGLIEHDAVEVRRLSAGTWIADSSGRSWCKRSGKATFIRDDGSQLVEEFESEAVFNGNEGRHLYSATGADRVRRMSASVSDGFVDEGPSPLEFTTHYLRLPISSLLAERGTTVAGHEVWEGRPVVVVETAPLKNRQEFKRQFWIDPARGFIAVRRVTLVRYGDARPWHVHLDAASLEHKEVAPGVWLPQRIESKSFAVPAEEPASLRLVVDVKGHFSDWQVNQEQDESNYRLAFPVDLPRQRIRVVH